MKVKYIEVEVYAYLYDRAMALCLYNIDSVVCFHWLLVASRNIQLYQYSSKEIKVIISFYRFRRFDAVTKVISAQKFNISNSNLHFSQNKVLKHINFTFVQSYSQ